MRYSPSTRGFYPLDVHYPVLPGDLVQIDLEYHAELMAGQAAGRSIVPGVDGVPVLAPIPVPTPAQVQAIYTAAIEAHVDETARQRTYSGAVSCASYVASTVPQWAAEAGAFVAWRDSVWSYALAELAAVQAGTNSLPELADLIDALPDIAWPAPPAD